MKMILVAFGILLIIGSTLEIAYALAEPPSKEVLLNDIERMNSYSFTRKVTFDQFQVVGAHNGTTFHVEKRFAYTGKVLTKGKVNMTSGVITEYEEFYINDTFVMKGNLTVNLLTWKISGTVTFANGTSMEINELWKEYYGMDSNMAISMIQEDLPMLAFKDAVLNSSNLKEVKGSFSLSDRILMGLGLREKLFEYEFTTKSGKRWCVFVDSNGVPRKFESETGGSKIVVYVTPTG